MAHAKQTVNQQYPTKANLTEAINDFYEGVTLIEATDWGKVGPFTQDEQGRDIEIVGGKDNQIVLGPDGWEIGT